MNAETFSSRATNLRALLALNPWKISIVATRQACSVSTTGGQAQQRHKDVGNWLTLSIALPTSSKMRLTATTFALTILHQSADWPLMSIVMRASPNLLLLVDAIA